MQNHTGAFAVGEHLLEQTQRFLIQFDGEMNGSGDDGDDQQDVWIEVVFLGQKEAISLVEAHSQKEEKTHR